MNVRRARWLGAGLLLVLLLVVLVYVFGQYAVDRFVEPRVRRALPPALKVKDVDFQLLPLGIGLEGPRTTRDGPDSPAQLQADRISVNLTWSSMFGDTVTLDDLEFEGLTLDVYPTVPSRSQLEGESSPFSALFAGGAPGAGTGQFLVKQLSITGGRIRFFDGADSEQPSFVFEPVDLSAGPISPAHLRRGLPVRMEAGVASRRRALAVQGQLALTHHPTFTGTLHAESFPVDELASWLPSALRATGGTLDATAPFLISPDGLQVESVDLLVRDTTLGLGSLGAAAASPTTANASAAPDAETTPASAQTSFLVSLGESRLKVENVRFRVASEGDAQTLDVREGTLVVGSLFPARADVSVKGQFAFSRPTGLMEFTASLDRTAPEFRLRNVLSQTRVDRVQELNPYTREWFPMTLKGGSLTAGLKGDIATSHLDLAVELSFAKLKAGAGKNPDSTFMGIPISLLLKQLGQKDGSLELGFRVTGPPSSPTVDISRIRQRLVVKLGMDAAVLATLGLPVYAGDKVLEKTTGISVIGEVRNVLGGLTTSRDLDSPSPSPDRSTRGTAVPKRETPSSDRQSKSSRTR